MKRITIIIMTLIGCLVHSNTVEAQKVKDAFVLVDVSGSMKNVQINSEAKQIISSMLQGNMSLSNYTGWSQVKSKGLDGNCPLISVNSTPLISLGGKVCIIPFGNMNRVKEYKFVDMSNFDYSFNSSFPTSFTDQWTYITLAKAYAVNVSSKNDISGMVYMIIYSDGAEESMDGRVGYPEEFRDIVDYFGTRNDSFCQKKGIIRKSFNNKQFDIVIWTLGPIPIREEPLTGDPPGIGSIKIEIINQPNGKSPKNPIEINVKDPISLKWKSANGKVNINVQRKNGNTYTNIPASERDNYYTLEKKTNSATITFYEPQDYKVIVADSHSRDDRYFQANGNILKDVFPFIIIAIFIIGGVVLWKLLAKPKSDSEQGWVDNNRGGRNSGNKDDDWN